MLLPVIVRSTRRPSPKSIVIRGTGRSGRAIGFRADMDALPIEEETGAPYASRTPGVMHACGHDGHTTMLLGAARYLAETRRFSGTAVFIFQPAEEGLGGARAMLADGLFERFPCDEVYGMHNAPYLEPGQVAVWPGVAMAGADFFDIAIRGRGSHGAMPQESRDPTLVAVTLALFVFGMPAVLVGTAAVHGVIFDPLRNELFTSSRGSGTVLNEKRVRVADRKDLNGAMVFTGFPPRERGRSEQHLDCIKTLLTQAEDIRRTGSAARIEDINGRPLQVRETRLRGPDGALVAWQWYWIDGGFTANDYLGKLLQAKERLLMRGDDGAGILVYARYEENPEAARAALRSFIAAQLPSLLCDSCAEPLDGLELGTGSATCILTFADLPRAARDICDPITAELGRRSLWAQARKTRPTDMP